MRKLGDKSIKLGDKTNI